MTVPKDVQGRIEFVLSEYVIFSLLEEFLDIENYSYDLQYYDSIYDVYNSSFSEIQEIKNEYPNIDLDDFFNNPVDTFKQNSDLSGYFENVDEVDSIQFYAFAETVLRDSSIKITSSEITIEY